MTEHADPNKVAERRRKVTERLRKILREFDEKRIREHDEKGRELDEKVEEDEERRRVNVVTRIVTGMAVFGAVMVTSASWWSPIMELLHRQ